MKPLTDAQREFAEKNHNLIYKFIHNRNLSVEEYYDVCAIAYVKAVATFNQNKSKFSTYAYHCMHMAVNQELRLLTTKGRHMRLIQDSLDEMITNEKVGKSNRHELIRDVDSLSWEDALCDKIMIDSLCDRDRRVIELKMYGMSQSEIARELGCSQPYISRILNKFKKMIT